MGVFRKKKKLLVNQFITYTWLTVAREKHRERNAYRSSHNGNIEKFVFSFTSKSFFAVKPSLTTSPTATTRVCERNPMNVHLKAISSPRNLEGFASSSTRKKNIFFSKALSGYYD